MKNPTRRLLAVATLTAVLLAPTGCAPAALPAGSRVPYPTGYRSWHHVKSMVIQPGHPLHDAFGGMHHVYANAAAERGLATGVYEDGAVFAFDLLATRDGDHAIQEGERKVLGVMHRAQAAFAATGGWGFAGFAAPDRDVVTDAKAQCFACHEGQREHGYVFTRPRP